MTPYELGLSTEIVNSVDTPERAKSFSLTFSMATLGLVKTVESRLLHWKAKATTERINGSTIFLRYACMGNFVFTPKTDKNYMLSQP